MYRHTRRALATKPQRTRFGLSGSTATLEPASLGDRARLTALHAFHVEGRDLEQARTDKGLRFGKQQPRSPQPFATHFVQRDAQPIQCLAHTSPADALTCEIDVDLKVVSPPTHATLRAAAGKQPDTFRAYVSSTVQEALDDAKATAASHRGPSATSPVSYIEDALLVPAPRDGCDSLAGAELTLPWAEAHRVVLSLLGDRNLAAAHPFHLPRCVDPESLDSLAPGIVPSLAVAHSLPAAIAVEFSSDLHGLGRVLGDAAVGSLRRWMAGALARKRCGSEGSQPSPHRHHASVGEKKSTSLRLEWVQEELQRAVWATGVKVRANSEAHSPRSDVQHTSEEQARRALEAIAALWESLAGGASSSTMAQVLPCGGLPRLTLQADQHFVFLRIRFSERPESNRAAPAADAFQQEPAASGSSLAVVTDTAPEVYVPRRDAQLPLQLATAEATLVKRGLPHDFVANELRDQLEAARDHAAFAAGIDPERLPPIKLLVRGVMSRHGETVQRVKITNVVPGHVAHVAARLATADGLATLDTVDNDSDPALTHFRRAARGARPTAGAFLCAPNVRALVVWKPNGLLHESRRNGFVALSGRRRKRHHTDPSRKDRGSGVRAQQRDAVPATVRDPEFWNVHSYALHDVRDGEATHTYALSSAATGVSEAGDEDSRELETTMRLGDLWGYRHTVTLRNIIAPSDLERSLQSVASAGFLNYFGPQRFTMETQRGIFVGLQLLRGEFRGAANVLVDVGDSGDFFSVDLAGAGSGFSAVRRDLLRLLRSTADGGGSEQSCRDAFLHGLGPVVVKRFVNEALCAVWNSAASARLKRHGAGRVLEGDIVRPRPPPSVLEAYLAAGRSEQSAPPPALVAPDALEPVFVTKEDVAARRFSVHDVVLPIPGAGVVLPRNDSGTHTVKMLASHGVHLHPEHAVWPHFVAQGNPLGVDVVGGYRYLLERPLNFSWVFKPDESDKDGAEQRRNLQSLGATWAQRGQSQRADLEFDLPASAFSWSLLREVARSNVVSEADVNRSSLNDPNEVDRDAPTKRFAGGRLERSLREQVKKPRDHYGTDLMAIGKIEAQIFAKGSVDGAGPLADPRTPVGRQSAAIRIGRGKL